MTPTHGRSPSSQETPDSQVPPTGDADGHTRPHRVHPREHVVAQLVGVDDRSLPAVSRGSPLSGLRPSHGWHAGRAPRRRTSRGDWSGLERGDPTRCAIGTPSAVPAAILPAAHRPRGSREDAVERPRRTRVRRSPRRPRSAGGRPVEPEVAEVAWAWRQRRSASSNAMRIRRAQTTSLASYTGPWRTAPTPCLLGPVRAAAVKTGSTLTIIAQ
jgi:hypothetical protein